jgi:hypothetical protein
MNHVRQFVTALLESRPDVIPPGTRPPVDPDIEDRLLEDLHDWRARADAARRRHVVEQGEAHSVSFALESTPMSPREVRSCQGLYVAYAALLASLMERAHRTAREHGIPVVPLEECLSDTYEMMVRSLVTYDPSKAGLSTWLSTDTRWMMVRSVTADTGPSVPTVLYEDWVEDGTLPPDWEPEDDGADAPDEPRSSLYEIAEEIAALDPATAALAARLFGTPGSTPTIPHTHH